MKYWQSIQSRKTFPLAVLVLALAALLAGCGMQAQAQAETTPSPAETAAPAVVVAEGRLKPVKTAWLNFNQPGRIGEVLVQAGQQVAAGEALARLSDRLPAEAALRAAELELAGAQQALDDLNQKAGLAGETARRALVDAQQAAIAAHQALADLDTNATQQEIDAAWDRVQDRQTRLDEAQARFDGYQDRETDDPDRKNAETLLQDAQRRFDEARREYDRKLNDLEQARAAAAQADAAVEDARREYEASKDGPNPDDLKLAQARLDNAQAQQAAAQDALQNLELKAPFAGLVTDVLLSEGEAAGPGVPFIQIADTSQWIVETTDLTEMDIVRIQPDKPVTVTPDALPDLKLAGEVERVSDSFVQKGGDILYAVRIRLVDGDPALRWGMTVEVHFAPK